MAVFIFFSGDMKAFLWTVDIMNLQERTLGVSMWVAPEHGLGDMVFAVFIPKDKTSLYFITSGKYKYYYSNARSDKLGPNSIRFSSQLDKQCPDCLGRSAYHRCLRRWWCPRGSAHCTGSRDICKVAEENKLTRSDCDEKQEPLVVLPHHNTTNIIKTKHLPTREHR